MAPSFAKNEIEFLRFFEIITSSLSTTSHLPAWIRVEGPSYKLPIAAGFTPIQAPAKIGKGQFGIPTTKASSSTAKGTANVTTTDMISLEEALFKYHDAQKVLFFSKLQMALLDVS